MLIRFLVVFYVCIVVLHKPLSCCLICLARSDALGSRVWSDVFGSTSPELSVIPSQQLPVASAYNLRVC